jgi:ribose transport system permease protein
MKRLGPVIGWAQRNGLFFALVILVVVFSLLSPRFFTASNLTTILLNVAVVGIIAVPGAMLILSGYVDLAVGSIAVLVSIVFGELMHAGASAPVAFVAALATGTAWGLASGLLITYLGFSPIIVTLGGLAGARGLAELISQGITQYSFGPGFAVLGNGTWLGVPVPVWIFVATFACGGYVWYQMPYGRHMTAIGADRVAARSLGIPVKRIPLVLYVASGFASALGGFILTSELDAASLSIGQGLELEVLTGILLGGVSFLGGRGSLFGVLVGVVFIGALDNGLVVINISPFFAGVATGAALVFAAGLDVFYQRLDQIQIAEAAEPEDAAQPAVDRGGLAERLRLWRLR